MLKNKSRRHSSFHRRLLLGFIGLYLLIGAGSAALVVANYRETAIKMRQFHKKWLNTYAKTFLSDIEMGNTIAVRNKLEILVQRDIVASAVLRFGKHELSVAKAPTEGVSHNSYFEKLITKSVHYFLPRYEVSISVSDASRTIWGNLKVYLDPIELYGSLISALEKFLVYSASLFLICFGLILLFIDDMVDTVHALTHYIQIFSIPSLGENNIQSLLEASPQIDILELDIVAMEFKASAVRILNLTREIEQHKADAAIGQIIRQVAHDIRSPLAALDSILKDLAQLPEEKRIIVRSAIGRIRDIANDLLDRHRKTAVSSDVLARPDSEPASVQLLSALTERLITEKRMQYRALTGVNIEANFSAASTPSPEESAHALASLEGNAGAASYGLFAEIQPTEFKRVLSNLINNSIEALEDKGSVIVTLDSEGERVLIKVEDNGRGIPPEVLAKIGQKGETFGKAGGSGLGLYHARKALESWGGSLDIKSELNKGATALVNLPKSPTPHWFASRLVLAPNSPVVVLDDDASIHQVWQGRFNSLKVQDNGIEIFHFSTPQDFRRWVQGDRKRSETALYLSDYELLGHKETGLDLAEELKTGPRTILVTSRYEEQEVLKRCLNIQARMIPKGLSAFVPIMIHAGLETPDAILIDDDPLVRLTWTMSAKRAQKTVSAFSGVSDFLNQSASFDPKTPVYIDRDLGGGIKGDEAAQEIYERGFKEIYLATGYEMENAPAPWIKKVVGKESPWVEEAPA